MIVEEYKWFQSYFLMRSPFTGEVSRIKGLRLIATSIDHAEEKLEKSIVGQGHTEVIREIEIEEIPLEQRICYDLNNPEQYEKFLKWNR